MVDVIYITVLSVYECDRDATGWAGIGCNLGRFFHVMRLWVDQKTTCDIVTMARMAGPGD